MKLHENNETWKYDKPYGYLTPVYKIDGEFRTEHLSAQYLMDTYKMNIGEAYAYVNQIARYGG